MTMDPYNKQTFDRDNQVFCHVIDRNCQTCLYKNQLPDPDVIGPCGNIERPKTVCQQCYNFDKWHLDSRLFNPANRGGVIHAF